MVGLLMSHSRGEGGYRGADEDELSSTVTGLYPDWRYRLAAGYRLRSSPEPTRWTSALGRPNCRAMAPGFTPAANAARTIRSRPGETG